MGFGEKIWRLEFHNETRQNGHQKAHRSNTEPTVKPAPTEVSSTRSPFLRRPALTASFNARGIVAAVVLPKRSMLITTFFSGIPILSAASMMRPLLPWG